MSSHSDIEWTDATWNPIAGCSLVSPGCTNCYAMKRVAPRLANNQATPHYAGTVTSSKAGPVWTGKIGLAGESVLTKPLRWRRPRMIFVNSTSDLFHEDVPDAVIDRIFAVMALTPHHTYQVLTKRSRRMRDYVNGFTCDGARRFRVADAAGRMMEDGDNAHDEVANAPWPLPNVWLGVSVEDQRRADERADDLVETPAAVRFVSAEPLLGRIDFSKWLGRLDWIIVGGESGHGARPMHPDWARQIRDHCAAADVSFFFKQWGEWAPEGLTSERWIVRSDGSHSPMPTPNGIAYHPPRNGAVFMYRLGKHRAGRLLDGVEHNAMPQARR